MAPEMFKSKPGKAAGDYVKIFTKAGKKIMQLKSSQL
jgi:hypothetical protein